MKKAEAGFDAPKSNKLEQQQISQCVSSSGVNKRMCSKDVSNDPDDPQKNY